MSKVFMIELDDNMSDNLKNARWNEIIRRLTYGNKDEFISKLDLIKDISIAQKALITSPNAWFVIDNSLKMLPETIVYYQPLGYVTYQKYNCDIDFAIPKGFKMLSNHQLLPLIKWPNDFDKQIYLNIQKFIQDKAMEYFRLNEWFAVAYNTTFKTSYYRHTSLEEIENACYGRNIDYCHFNRECIQEAVDTFYMPKGKSKVKK